MAQTNMEQPHKVTLDQRSNLIMTGVTEVISFDDMAVILRTELGTLMVQGQQLQLKTLSVEGGQLAVEGKISSLSYEEDFDEEKRMAYQNGVTLTGKKFFLSLWLLSDKILCRNN